MDTQQLPSGQCDVGEDLYVGCRSSNLLWHSFDRGSEKSMSEVVSSSISLVSASQSRSENGRMGENDLSEAEEIQEEVRVVS